MNKPEFFIIGAPKCGTTSLSIYLSQHPEVCFSEPKEPHFVLTDIQAIAKSKLLPTMKNVLSAVGRKLTKSVKTPLGVYIQKRQ